MAAQKAAKRDVTYNCNSIKIPSLMRKGPIVVATCCVLHNLCETNGDNFDEDWLKMITAVLVEEIVLLQVQRLDKLPEMF